MVKRLASNIRYIPSKKPIVASPKILFCHTKNKKTLSQFYHKKIFLIKWT